MALGTNMSGGDINQLMEKCHFLRLIYKHHCNAEDKVANVEGNAGRNFVIHCYRKQVFVGREGELEVWSKCGDEETVDEESYRRNYVDKVQEDSERGVIKKIMGGGDRLSVTREYVEGIEVWQSSYNSGVISVL